MVWGWIEVLEGIDLREDWISNLTSSHNLLNASDQRIEVTIICHPQLNVIRSAGRHHLLTLSDVHGHRLFAQNMLAGLSRSNGLSRVQIDRGRDIDGINLLIAE